MILSFPPFNQGYLAWLGLIPLLCYIQLYASSWKKAFLAGFAKGMLFFIYIHGYMALSVDFFFPPMMGYLVVLLGSAYSALFTGLFGLIFFYAARGNKSFLSSLAGASAWVLLEYLRSLGLLGHTGGFLGYSQIPYPYLLQAASVYGYWGLPFAMVIFQAAACLYLFSDRNKKITANLYASLVVLLLVLSIGISAPAFFPEEKEDNSLAFLLVQGNIHQKHVLEPGRAPENFQRYLDLTKAAYLEHDKADLVVWPETVYSSSVARRYPDAEGALSRLAADIQSPILFGAMHQDPVTGHHFNSIYLQKPGRERWETQRYDKIRLVPFAEYFPFPDLLNRFWDIRINLGLYSRGENIEVFETDTKAGTVSFGGVVCFESYFPQPALDTVRKGAKHLFILTNDAWFMESIGLDQHAAVGAMRAVETGVGVTQVANTGYTVSYDYTGRKVFQLPAWQEEFGILETELPRRTTLYRLWGDFFLWLCLILAAIWAAHPLLSKRGVTGSKYP